MQIINNITDKFGMEKSGEAHFLNSLNFTNSMNLFMTLN